MKRQKWQGESKVTPEQAMFAFQYFMLLMEWKRAWKVIDTVADLLTQAKNTLETARDQAADENAVRAYSVASHIMGEILDGEWHTKKWLRIRETALSQLWGEVRHKEGQVRGWRKECARLTAENAALEAKNAKLQEMIDGMIEGRKRESPDDVEAWQNPEGKC